MEEDTVVVAAAMEEEVAVPTAVEDMEEEVEVPAASPAPAWVDHCPT